MRDLELDVATTEPKDALIEALARARSLSLRALLEHLTLAELKAVCAAHELPVSGTKAVLADRILTDGADGAEEVPQTPNPPPTPAPSMSPSTASILEVLGRERLFDLARVFGVGLRDARQPKAALAKSLAEALGEARLLEILPELGRDELRAVCRSHGLTIAPSEASQGALSRDALIDRLAQAAGIDERPEPPPLMTHDGVPRAGQVLATRGRQWLIEAVVEGEHHESPLLRLACLDDDDPGRKLDILWDLELGGRVIEPEAHGLGHPEHLDPPSHFGAYLHALRWSAASASDATRFQAPFRAGIKLMAHQLTP
ncbi:MAG: SAP domain-containing protein, partial [Myxococcales bacterium]|nr:SAP domain-containing protein [Myxococcales bacterium]